MARPKKGGLQAFLPLKSKTTTAVQYTRIHSMAHGGLKSKTGFMALNTPKLKEHKKQPPPSIPPNTLKPTGATNASTSSSTGENVASDCTLPFPDLQALPNAVRESLNKPLKQWVDVCDEFLQEELRREGCMGFDPTVCCGCSGPGSVYRCRDCEGGELYCEGCIQYLHQQNGLHVIEGWNGTFFKTSSLKALGHRFQLGHRIGEVCPTPVKPYGDDFVVIHTNGIHEVSVDFCGCPGASERYIQLLRYGWFPATTHLPRTAATFQVLKQFQLHSFESKCSVLEFYQALARLGDNVGVQPIRDRYRAFLTIVREYRHLKMLKRAGRGHDECGIAGTTRGECAVLCAACPQPGRNLPPNWMDVKEKDRWIYRLFLAIDANFRLKRRKVSSEEVDPSLGKGWAYFVDHAPYMEHIRQHMDRVQPKSTCSSHSAVNNSRLTDGLSVSGVGSVGCARHDCFRPHAVGDLQKGERYINMDYLFLSSLPRDAPADTNVSYDVVCQWIINLLARMAEYGIDLQHDPEKLAGFTYLVPKFHLPAHVGSCQTQFSFNFEPNVGRTDGEAPERGWSYINPIALSTCEMGPGSRRDTVDDHLGDWNWKKVTGMGMTLLKRIRNAVEECDEQMFRFHQYDLGLRTTMRKDVKAWEKEVVAWENDKSCPNPFEVRVKKPTQEAVRKALAEEDRTAQAEGTAYVLHSMFSGSELVAVGLELEEQQRQLRLDTNSLGVHATDDQKTKILSRGNNLHRRVSQWIGVQERYIPSATTLREDNDNHPSTIPTELWEMPLFLPSCLPKGAPCDNRLREIEWRLRTAQAHTALDELRRALRLRSYLYIDKDRFSRGQKQNTRSRTLIQRTESKVQAAKSKYQTARSSIESLAPFLGYTTWQQEFPVLKDGDVRALQVDSDTNNKKRKKNKKGPSEGTRQVSWIWGAFGDGYEGENPGDESVELKDDLRVEWSKSRARAKRWQEEVILLKEEMRRVVMFLDTEAQIWQDRARFRSSTMDDILWEGLAAYALQQAEQRLMLKQQFEVLWSGVDALIRQKASGLLGRLVKLGLITDAKDPV